MTTKSLILEQLDREAEVTKRALAAVPEGKNDWKPHPKSMPLGMLAHMVATMPSWFELIVKQDELDVKPKEGSAMQGPRELPSPDALMKAHDQAVDEARQAVSGVTDDFLNTHWKLLEAGKVMMDRPRYQAMLDNFTHLAHHRGQLTVYLRLNDVKVPAVYGPSADDHRF